MLTHSNGVHQAYLHNIHVESEVRCANVNAILKIGVLLTHYFTDIPLNKIQIDWSCERNKRSKFLTH